MSKTPADLIQNPNRSWSLRPAFEIKESFVDDDGVLNITSANLVEVSMAPNDWTHTDGRGLGVIIRSDPVVQPSDANEPLPALPTDFAPSDVEIARAVDSWNEKEPEFNGLLDAKAEA